MSREAQIERSKDLLMMVWWLSIFVIPAPITARPGQSHSTLFVFLGFPMALTILGGTHRLLFPHVAPRLPYLVHIGLAATTIFLLFSPAAFRISIANFDYKPMWLVTTIIGTVAGIAYLLMYVRRFVGAKPPNTSLERTRDR
jgi:hypothetical protein